MKVNVGDINLNVEVYGIGEPLVLLHGFTGSAQCWEPIVRRLGSRSLLSFGVFHVA